MSYTIQLDSFEGPFDLLLHLININEIDIYDIPVSEVTRQYIEYLNKMTEMDMEITSSFMVMASVLLELKSNMLLPWRQSEDDKLLSDNDPRTELVIRLLEYKKYKYAANFLQDREQFSRSLSKPQGELEQFVLTYDNEFLNQNMDKNLLIQAIARLNTITNKLDKNRQLYFHSLKKDAYTVTDQIDMITSRIEVDSNVNFNSLFSHESTKSEVIVTFLAILELLKKRIIMVRQSDNFQDIIINKSNQESEQIGA